jgi:hypothetical protein
VGPIIEILRWYRAHPGEPVPETPLTDYLDLVQAEVESLELLHRIPGKTTGDTTRRALCFLRGFGRISALDFDHIPVEHRPALVHLLQLEYRWCFAAAGTTQQAFKIAIGRTGAR